MMECLNCAGRMQCELRDVPYRSLPGTTLENVEVWVCPECGEEEVVLPALNELERLLVDVVCRQQGRLPGNHVRFLRKHLGWSGVDFARHFGVSPETVSRWENEVQPMGPQADRLLRVCATRLQPINDYAGLEELLDTVGTEHSTGALHVRRAGSLWERAA